MSLLNQEPQEIVREESQENREDDLESLTWREVAGDNIVVLEGVIEEIVRPTENGDKYPDHLFEVANTILMISSGMNSLESHEEDFEHLRVDASGLVVVLWKLYNKSRSNWPPSKLRIPIKELVRTVRSIHKLMKRKCETNSVKRALVGIRNLGKFKKYRQRLASMASFLEGKLNNINIEEVLLEVVNSRIQPQVRDTELSAEAANPHTNKGTKEKTDTQENRAEGSHLREAEQSTVASGKRKEKINQSSNSREFKGAKTMGQNNTKDDSADEKPDDRSAEDKSAKEKAASKPLEEATDNIGTKDTNKVTPTLDDEVLESEDKGKARISNDEEGNAGVPIDDPATKKVPSKKKKVKSQSVPAPHSHISGFSFQNTGSGKMFNTNVGKVEEH